MGASNESVFNKVKEAFEDLKGLGASSRELSLVYTKLEEAMMWLNKHRTITGEFGENPTHVK